MSRRSETAIKRRLFSASVRLETELCRTSLSPSSSSKESDFFLGSKSLLFGAFCKREEKRSVCRAVMSGQRLMS